MQNMQELSTLVQSAIANGDMAEFTRLSQLVAQEAEVERRANLERARKADEELASRRAELSKAHITVVKKLFSSNAAIAVTTINSVVALLKAWPTIVEDMQAVGAIQLEYKMADEQSDVPRLALRSELELKPATSRKGIGGRSATSVTTEQVYGMKLDAMFKQFATDDELKQVAEATANGKNSKAWQIKAGVKKKAIDNGLVKPAQ